MGDRVLSWQDGERQMTDLAHMTQLLQEAAHREHFSLPALRDWLRDAARGAKRRNRTRPPPRQRRGGGADHDGVGGQGPAVPGGVPAVRVQPQRAGTASWCCSTRAISGACTSAAVDSPDFNAVSVLGRKEDASDDSRLMYVAMTRAQSQVVAWWAPSWDEPNGGLSRLLRGRRPGEAEVPDRCVAGQDLRRRRDGAAAGVGGRGRAGHRGVGRAAGPRVARRRAAKRPRARGTSTARSTPRGGGRRTRA